MLFDTHAHMDDLSFDADRAQLLQSLQDAGITLLMKSRLQPGLFPQCRGTGPGI